MNLLTPSQAVELIGISRVALHHNRQKGFLTGVKQRNGYFLYERTEVERFDAERKRQKKSKEKLRASKRKISEKDLLSGRNSGIQNYHGIVFQWMRWCSRIGGNNGITKWPTMTLEQWLEDVQEVAITIDAVREELKSRKNKPLR